MSIKLSKTFIRYSLVYLLCQNINFLRLATTKKELHAISKFEFYCILRHLKYYFGLMGKLYKYIRGYTKISELLQIQKTFLLRNALLTKNIRQSYSSHIPLKNLTFAEFIIYQKLQMAIFKKQYLVYFNPS